MVRASRAKVSDWSCRVALEVDVLLGNDVVIEAGTIGGRTIGVCDYRPECGGWFGRFKMSLIE